MSTLIRCGLPTSILAAAASSALAVAPAPSWSVPESPGGGPAGPNDEVRALISSPPEQGQPSRLMLGGAFTGIEGSTIVSPYLAAWNGHAWSPGPGLDNEVLDLAIHPIDGLPALVASGYSDLIHPTQNYFNITLAYQRSGVWHGISVPGSGYIFGLASFTLPGSPASLAMSSPFSPPFSYIAGLGSIDTVDNRPTASLAQLGEGLFTVTNAFAVFDADAGARLFAGAGSEAAQTFSFLAEFDGSAWINTPGGPTGTIHDMIVFDDGSGPALFIAGGFIHVGGNQACSRIVKYQHGIFTPLATGFNADVWALAVHDDGSGPALFAAGQFTAAGTLPINRIAKWQNASWHPLDAGLGTGVGAPGGVVYALATFDDDAEGPLPPALYAAGTFLTANAQPARRFARWGESYCPIDLDNGSGTGTRDLAVDINDLLFFLNAFEQGAAAADLDNDGDPVLSQPDEAVDINDLLFFLARFETGC